MATFEVGPAGLLAHVYTVDKDRQKGASSKLLDITLADAKARGCRVLYLSSEFGKHPHRLYARLVMDPSLACLPCMPSVG